MNLSWFLGFIIITIITLFLFIAYSCFQFFFLFQFELLLERFICNGFSRIHQFDYLILFPASLFFGSVYPLALMKSD